MAVRMRLPREVPPPPAPPPESQSSRGSKTKHHTSVAEKKLSISDPEWQWSCYEVVEDQNGRSTKRKIENNIQAESELDDGPFQVIYQRRLGIVWSDVVRVTLTSTPLRKILQHHFPKDGDLHSLTKPEISGRFLYAALESLKSHAAQLHVAQESSPRLDDNQDLVSDSSDAAPNSTTEESNGYVHLGSTETVKSQDMEVDETAKESSGTEDDKSGALHLKHLVRFLETEYKDVIIRDRRMKEEKRVSWDMLWTALSKGTKVAYYCDHSGELLCGVVANNNYSPCFFNLELLVWNFNGKQYKECHIPREIRKFEGECEFARLPVSPVEILGNPSSLDAEFFANGKRFYELAVKSANRYMLYSGPMFRIQCGNLIKTKSDGRVMIDLTSFAAMKPDYPMGHARPPAAKRLSPPSSVFQVPRRRFGRMEDSAVAESVPSQETDEEVLDESLIFAPAIVYGFSFALKEWGSFAVSGFSDIIFDTEAFEELTMDPGTKCLIHNLVGQYIGQSDDQDDSMGRVPPPAKRLRVDPIAKKGEGCIFLCYGPPGTGKTLTAESIAEKMMQPLWVLSVSELGTTPKELEVRLVKVLEIAAKWHAVLLLDEADVYLEKRTSGGDLVRNAMTGVFLRLLEYYQGVLFLTTNRIGTFDDAFRSRISMFLRYPPLSVQNKGKVWRTLLTRVNVEGLSEKFCEEMAGRELNGREIRNCIHMAQVWARSKGEVLAVSHVAYVTDILADSLKALTEEIQERV